MVLGSTSMRCGGGTPAYLSGEKASRLVLDPWNGTDSFDRRFLPTVRMATSSSIQLSMITPCLSSVGSGDGRNECQARTGRRRGKGDLLLGCDFHSKSVVVRGRGSRRVPGAPVGVDMVAEPDARPDTALPLLVRHCDVHVPATVL